MLCAVLNIFDDWLDISKFGTSSEIKFSDSHPSERSENMWANDDVKNKDSNA